MIQSDHEEIADRSINSLQYGVYDIMLQSSVESIISYGTYSCIVPQIIRIGWKWEEYSYNCKQQQQQQQTTAAATTIILNNPSVIQVWSSYLITYWYYIVF